MVFGENTMNGKTLIGNTAVTTQTPQAVAALLKFCKRPSNPMPTFVELNGGVRLTRSKKGDCYYTTSLNDCSCKARTFNPGTPCNHMKALQASVAMADSKEHAKAYQAKERALRGSAPMVDSIRQHVPFKPICPDEAEASPSFQLVDTTPDANPREVAYLSLANFLPQVFPDIQRDAFDNVYIKDLKKLGREILGSS